MPPGSVKAKYKKKWIWILVSAYKEMIQVGHQTRALIDLIKNCVATTPRNTAIANLKWNATSCSYYLVRGWRFGVLTNLVMLIKTLFSLFFDIVDLMDMPTYAIRARPYQILCMMITVLIAIGMTVWTNDIRNLVHPIAYARFYLATNIPLIFAMLAHLCIVNMNRLVVAFWNWFYYVMYHTTVALFGRINPIMFPLYLIVDTGIFGWLGHFIVIVCLKPVFMFFFGRRNCMFAIFWSFYDFLDAKFAHVAQIGQPAEHFAERKGAAD